MAITNSPTPLIKEGWLRAITFCAAYMLATYVASLITGGAIVAYGTGKDGQTTLSLETLVTIALVIIAVVSIVLALVFRRFVDRKPITSLGIDGNPQSGEIISGLLLAIFLLGIGTLVLYFAGTLNWIDARFSGSELFTAIISMLLISAAEEMVFRGYLLNNLMESFNKWVALLVSAGMFAIVHSLNPEIGILPIINIFLGGLLLGMNFIYTRTLWFSIAFHFGWNFLQGQVLGFAVSGYEEPSILQQELKGHPIMTGNEFGFEGSIIATAVLLAGIGLLYYTYERKSKNLPTF